MTDGATIAGNIRAGANIGGKIGAFVGVAVADDPSGAVPGAAIGSVVGGTAGAAYGVYQAITRSDKLKDEDQCKAAGNCHANEKAEEDKDPKVTVDGKRYPESAKHIDDAQAAGQPTEVTVDRGGADANREESLDGVPSPEAGQDRDEYPPAVASEGGEGASVREIPSSDNRGAGASMGGQLRKYPDGTKVKIETK